MAREVGGGSRADDPRPAPVIGLDWRSGRLRSRRHLLLALLAASAGWLWFGVAGALPLLLWCWLARRESSSEVLCLDVARARSASLGRWRTRIEFAPGESMEIFRDEVDAAELARLRRELKRQLATG